MPATTRLEHPRAARHRERLPVRRDLDKPRLAAALEMRSDQSPALQAAQQLQRLLVRVVMPPATSGRSADSKSGRAGSWGALTRRVPTRLADSRSSRGWDLARREPVSERVHDQ